MSGTPATGRDLHIDVALSNVIVNRRPEGFIADSLVPVTTVEKQTDFYWKFNHLEFRRHEQDMTLRAPKTRARKIGMTVSTDTYAVKNYALGAEWSVEDDVNADAVLQWAETQSTLIMDALMVDYEMRLADLATNTSNVGTVTTISSNWSDPDNSTPFDDLNTEIDNYRQRTGVRPNTIIIPEQVRMKLRNNAQLRTLLFGDGGGLVDANRFAGLLEIPNVLLPMSQVNTAGETETINDSGTLSDIWGNHIWLAHIRNLSGRDVDTWMNAFRWVSPMFGVPFAVQRFPFDPKTKTFEIEVGYYQDEKIVSPDLAVRIADVLG